MFTFFLEFYGGRGFLIGNFIVRIRYKICFFLRAAFFFACEKCDFRFETFDFFWVAFFVRFRMFEWWKNLSAHAKCFRRVHGSHFIPFHACLFTKGNVSSPQGNFILPKGNLISPKRNANSHQGDMISPKGNMISHKGNMILSKGNTMLRETLFHLGEASFLLKETCFYLKET